MPSATNATRPPIFLLHSGLLAFFYGVIFAGQTLGMLNAFSLPAGVFLSILAGVSVFVLLLRMATSQFLSSLTPSESASNHGQRWLYWVLLIAGGLMFLFAVFTPTWRWPHSSVYRSLEWDAGVYHFPKAISLFRSGSAWDFSVPFAEYPFGYESLLALGMILTGNEALFGPFHALISTFFLTTLWLLARRLLRLPNSLLFFILSTVMISGALVHKGNPWWIFDSLSWSIGMNDLFLAALILSAFLYAPISKGSAPGAMHPVGMATASMIALSNKPNALILIPPLWLLSLWWIKRQEPGQAALHPFPPSRILLLCAGLILPGLLWPIRNLVILNALFTPKVLRLQQSSLINNLTNPYFYKYLPRTFLGVTLVFLISILSSRWIRRPPPSVIVLFALSFIALAFTPASAFLHDLETPTIIRWRFGIPLLSLTLLTILILLEPWIDQVFGWFANRRFGRMLLAVLILLVAGFCVWQIRTRLRVPKNPTRVLRDQFPRPVGTDGYYSAYDYVQRNIRNAVVEVRNGLDFYIYGPGYTNAPARLDSPPAFGSGISLVEPDYLLVFCTAWWGSKNECPEGLERASFKGRWDLIYEDPEGKLFQRRPNMD